MILPPTPTLNEWIVLINQDAEDARQHMEWLQSQIKQGGVDVAPALVLSIEKYDQARRLISSAVDNPEVATQIAKRMTLGRATLDTCPNHDAWLALIAADPTFARRLYLELCLKQAHLGRESPPSLLESLAIYDTLPKQHEGTQE